MAGNDEDVEKEDSCQRSSMPSKYAPLEKAKDVPPGLDASLVMLYLVFLVMFTIGCIRLNKCPINKMIPIYLIVTGVVGAVGKYLSKTENKYLFNVAVALITFNILWQILGSCWVFKEYQPSYEEESELYCDRTAYLLAFWILVIQYTLLAVFILCSLCYLLMRGSFKKG